MRANYPLIFKDDGTLFNHLVVMTDACACDCVYMCVNFEEEILLRGKNVKTWINLKFSQNDQLPLWYRLQTWKSL